MILRANKLSAMLISLSCCLLLANSIIGSSFVVEPSVKKQADTCLITFTLDAPTDVEIAILDNNDKIVRHLAAGLLTADSSDTVAPPAPLKPGLAQQLTWDGKDDFGHPAQGASVRVRIGMDVKLTQIAGGDPYAYWSEYSFQGDHAQFKVSGVEAKSDGKVYLIGHSTFYGYPVIRQYDAKGNYLKTLFPPPAGRDIADVAAWGVNIEADGTYTLRPSFGWATAVPNRQALAIGGGGGGTWCATFLSSPDPTQIVLATPPAFDNLRMAVGSDGALREAVAQPILNISNMPKRLYGHLFSATTADGKTLFISSVRTSDAKEQASPDNEWRDGQIWRINLTNGDTKPFFSLNSENSTGERKNIGSSAPVPFTALQGMALDNTGHLFVCDRLNQRLLVLDVTGKIVHSLAVSDPEDVALTPDNKGLYLLTRYGDYTGKGELHLLKFNDWQHDKAPSLDLKLSGNVGKFPECARLAIARDGKDTFVWVAYTILPARVFRDTGNALELVKDFYASGPKQRALDMRCATLDTATGDAYVADGHSYLFRVSDWQTCELEVCRTEDGQPLRAANVAIDPHKRILYTLSHYGKPVQRWRMENKTFKPMPGDPPTGVTQPVTASWIFTGLGHRGLAVSPDGGIATLGVIACENPQRGWYTDYTGPLNYFKPDTTKTPWPVTHIPLLNDQRLNTGGVRFDLHGNLYVGIRDGKPDNVPAVWAKDNDFLQNVGRIYKFAPTGKIEDKNLFPTSPTAPAKIYNIHYGALASESKGPRFDVDGYGRIYYPSAPLTKVSVIDNIGQPLLSFGTYSNRDSTGGLTDDLVPVKGIPLGQPASVAADDDHIVVSDILNVRLLRLTKTFASTKTIKLQ